MPTDSKKKDLKMEDIIRLLPDSVANQIAAGEVIQRPASVVKELVENSIDAGADRIQVIIKDAGRTLIQVVDNGKGMSPMDARMAFERHATSKIVKADDLFALHTMGFRGEALASIAAVAQIELLSMRPGDTMGTRLVIAGSKVESQEPAATVPGSNMMVKNLFYNVPARRKFLKKDAVELSNIMREFERLALVNPEVDLALIHNDNVVHQLLRGNLKQRIGALFGKGMERQMVPVEVTTSIVTINGFVGLPDQARKRGAQQFMMVNGRNMRHPYFHKAVMHCYEQLISPDEQPNYFLNFVVDPSTIDVNIHPTKHEIKFENEQPIWQILVAAIREALGKYNIAPSIDFDAEDALEIPAFNPNSGATTDFGPTEDYNPFAPASTPAPSIASPSTQSGSHDYSTSHLWQRDNRRAVDNWESLYQSFSTPHSGDVPPQLPDIDVVASRINDSTASGPSTDSTGEVTPIMQIGNRFIVTRGHGGLIVIDQRRAHVRVLYERYKWFDESQPVPSQVLMFPDVVNLTAAESALVESSVDLMASIGFDLAYLGDHSWSVNGVPGVIPPENATMLLRSIIADLSEGTSLAVEELHQRIALSLARAAAVTRGKSMTSGEMEHLVSELFSVSTPALTPDGKKVMAELSVDALASLLD